MRPYRRSVPKARRVQSRFVRRPSAQNRAGHYELPLVVRPGLLGSRTDDPYLDYGRFLTPEGGVLFAYKDLDLRLRYTLWRMFAWSCATGFALWILLDHSPVENGWIRLALLILVGVLNYVIVSKPVEVYRRAEIRPDCMILEGKDVFWREKMEAGVPSFRPDPDGNRILCGIYGSRFVEYLTVRRFDDNDRMPEVFAAHLEEAMTQLWLRPYEEARSS